MTDELFFNVVLAASSCMIVTGLILAAVKTPADGRTTKYRVAKYGLTVAVLVLIRPEEVTLRRVLWQTGAIVVIDGVLGGCFSCCRCTCSSMSTSCAYCSTWYS